MLKARDPRGWLHIFDDEVLFAFCKEAAVPPDLFKHRPVLRLASEGDPRLRVALHAEMQFWHELDRARIRIYEPTIRLYMLAVRKSRVQAASLDVQHQVRVSCAEQILPRNPLRDYGVDKMIADARMALEELVNPASMQWLPDVRDYFIFYA